MGNFALSIIDTLLTRALLPLAGIGWALLCEERGWGLFNHVSVPRSVAFIVTLASLDLVYYLQHYALHRVPVLWSFHRTHHTDDSIDFSTAARFHPGESLFTSTVVMGAVGLLGAPAIAVLASQVLSAVHTYFEHGNVRIPEGLNRVMNVLVITPDAHKIHHSVERAECNSNFGTLFCAWDRLFGTY